MKNTNTHSINKFCIWRTISLLLLTFMVMSCVSTKVIDQPAAPSDAKAFVYFIRENYPPYLCEVRLDVNGKQMATIVNNDFVAVNLPIGSCQIQLTPAGVVGPPYSFKLKVERPEKMYVLLTSDATRNGARLTGYREITISSQYVHRSFLISESEATKIITAFGKHMD